MQICIVTFSEQPPVYAKPKQPAGLPYPMQPQGGGYPGSQQGYPAYPPQPLAGGGGYPPADWAGGVEREDHHKEHQLPPGHRNNPQRTPKPSTSNAMARKKRGGERGHTGVQENPTEPRMEDMTRLREELLTILNQLGTQKLDTLVDKIRRLMIVNPVQLQECVEVIFEKAVGEADAAEVCAQETTCRLRE